jgi:uncharacterized protein (TIGR03086 family)
MAITRPTIRPVSVADLTRAFAMTRAIMANVTPSQYPDPTPCASWDVRGLVNHLVSGSHWYAATIRSGNGTTTPARHDYTEDDVLAAYDAGIEATTSNFEARGALERTITLPFGEFPAVRFLGLATSETFVHGWDLAKATGQPTDLDPALAEQLLTTARDVMPASFRGPDTTAPFAPEVPAPANADPAERLAAFLGRTP